MQSPRGTPLTDPPDDTPVSTASDAAQDEAGPQPATPAALLVLALVAGTALALDVVSKLVVVAELSDRPPVELLGGVVQLTETRNPGAAFSIGTSATWVFTVVAAVVVVAILVASRRVRSLRWALTLGLLLGGALGNLTDRVFRSPGFLRGHVVDWIDVGWWPVFNLADSAIVAGGALAVLLSLRGIELSGRRRA